MSFFVSMLGQLPRRWVEAGCDLQWRYPQFKWLFQILAKQMRSQDTTIQHGVGRGLRFNAGSANVGYLLGTCERAMQQALLCILRPGMCVYDVGANVGFITMLAAKLVGSAGRVVAFEPLAANAKQIEHNRRLNHFANVSVRREALGKQEGEADFRIASKSTVGKLASVGRVAQETGIIRVPIRKCDMLVTGGDVPRPDVMKIDVEGAEIDVLCGAKETLCNVRPLLLIELHDTNAAIAGLLSQVAYRIQVLGNFADILESPGCAQVFAWPAEKTEAACLAEALSRNLLS